MHTTLYFLRYIPYAPYMYHKLILFYIICKDSKLLVTFLVSNLKNTKFFHNLCTYFTLELQKETECIINIQHNVQQRHACAQLSAACIAYFQILALLSTAIRLRSRFFFEKGLILLSILSTIFLCILKALLPGKK